MGKSHCRMGKSHCRMGKSHCRMGKFRNKWARLALPLLAPTVVILYIQSMYNPEKHHRRSIRLKKHDYNNGFYFVTVCCEKRACIFGKIKDGIMLPNDYGKIALKEWLKTAIVRSNVKLHKFIVMPNHIHGILEINNTTAITATATVGARRALPCLCNLPNLHNSPNPSNPRDLPLAKRFQHQGKSTLPSIIGAYKSAVSKQIHETGFIGSIWQRNYFERIIRNEHSYQNMSQYIADNPVNWHNDEFYMN